MSNVAEIADYKARAKDWVKEVLELVAEGESSFWKAAVLIQRQIDDGMSQGLVAKELGMSRPWVNAVLGWKKLKGVSNADIPPKTPFSGRKTKKRKQPKSQTYHFDDLIQEECVDCTTEEQRWHNSLGNVAGDALSMEAYWTREFGNWEKFKVPSTHVTLARQAAEAWTKLAGKIAKMGGSRGKT